MAFSWSVIFLLGAPFVIAWYVLKKKYEHIEKLPGPPTKPLVGNALQLGRNPADVLSSLKQLRKKYGPIVRLWIGPRSLNLLVSSPKHIKEVLTTQAERTPLYSFLKEWIGDGLLLSKGETWEKQRDLLNAMFSDTTLEKYADVFNRNSDVLIDDLRREHEEIRDVEEIGSNFALNVACECLMGVKLSRQENQEFVRCTEKILEVVVKRTFSLLLRFRLIAKFTDDYKEQMRCVRTLNSFTDAIVAKRRERRRKFGAQASSSFLDDLLEAAEHDPTFTDKTIRHHLHTFIFGSWHTVALTIAFGLYELAKHPEVQSAILDEISSLLQDNKKGKFTFEQAQKMQYLERVIKEILRMYPPIALYENPISDEIEMDGVRIPKGTVVTVFVLAMHYDAEIYTDPEKFDPDRFLPENADRRPDFSYLPFSAAMSNGIGEKFAIVLLKLLFANVIRSFDIVPANPHDKMILGLHPVLKPVNKLEVRFKCRH